MALQQQNETIQQQNDYFQTEVLRRLSEQQQHLMQQPVGQSTQQTAAQMQQSQMLQQQLQQYENFQTEVMRRLSDVGADSPPLDTTAVRKDVSFQGEEGFAKFLQAQHLKMTERVHDQVFDELKNAPSSLLPRKAPSSLRNTIEMTVAATLKNKDIGAFSSVGKKW